jgi:cell division protein FtsB
MSTESERKKAKLQSEIEALEQQRSALETELEALETETEPKVYRRSF